ncbi:MAG: DNA (cytosine-5-)-methyltransferase [Candidatus Omnitrophota bacterium]
MANIVAIDLFCGAGGLTKGLELAKIKVVAGIDIDKSCKYPYEANNKAMYIMKDVSKIDANELNTLYPKDSIKVLVGCAPCQPFSTYSNRYDMKRDDKWTLLYQFSRLIKELSPDIVSMENVPKLVHKEVFKSFVEELKRLKYKVSFRLVDCEDYGVPQSRKRLVLLASKFGDIELVKSTNMNRKVTVRDVIYKLPPIKAGQTDSYDLLHSSNNLSPLNLERIKASKPGGTWRDWPESLRANCHKKDSGLTYHAVYGRMCWDKPSPTITTQCTGFGNGRFGHPTQNRAISLREAAMLQTFPQNYKFIDPNAEYIKSNISRMIGNAVPVRLGEIIGTSIRKHLRTYSK